MGISVVLRTRMFSPDMSQAASEVYLDIQLDALVAMDLVWLRLNPETPALHASGVRYHHEQIKDEWLDIGAALHDRVCDCKGLAAWRVAELRTSGEDPAARTCKKFAVVDDPAVGRLMLYHIQVERGDGTIEDPSRDLGMGGEEPDGYLPVPGVAFAVANTLTHTIGAGMLGDAAALAALDALRARAEAGDRTAKYLIGVAREIRARGYDPHKTKFVRRPDGAFEWTYPDGRARRGGSDRGGR